MFLFLALLFFFPIVSHTTPPIGTLIHRNIPKHHSGPRIAVVSVAIGDTFQKAVAFGNFTKWFYCQKHGYDLIMLREPAVFTKYNMENRTPHWYKIALIDSVLQDYDWIFWSDADSLFMQTNIPLENFISDQYDLVIAKEDVARIINTGQFLIRNCPWSQSLLTQAWDLYTNPSFDGDAGHYEQGYLEKAIHLLDEGRILVLEEVDINACYCDHPLVLRNPGDYAGEFIVHFPGTSGPQRLKELFGIYRPIWEQINHQ